MGISVGTISESKISTDTVSDGTVSGEKLGPELQPNFDMSQGTSGWTATETDIQAVVDSGDDAVLITSLEGTNDRGDLSISGLTIGKTYRVSIKARRGVQGSTQIVQIFTWASGNSTSVVSQSYQSYDQDVVATSTSGSSRAFSSAGGSVGDELYVSEVSIREIL